VNLKPSSSTKESTTQPIGSSARHNTTNYIPSNPSSTMPPQQKQRKMAIVGSRSVGTSFSLVLSSPIQPQPSHATNLSLLTHISPGKSSLTVQYVDGHFVDSYYPTIENTFSKVIRYRNHDFAVEMIDTAGQDEYSILNSKHFIGIHGYMIVYSVGSKQSFEMVRIIRDKILNHLVRVQSLPSPSAASASQRMSFASKRALRIVLLYSLQRIIYQPFLRKSHQLIIQHRAPTQSPSQS
jgi:hypothetical protein